jgi:hypothetical protein
MAHRHLQEHTVRKSDKPSEKPQPQWPDISKPDTRGGGGGDQKK